MGLPAYTRTLEDTVGLLSMNIERASPSEFSHFTVTKMFRKCSSMKGIRLCTAKEENRETTELLRL